MSKRIKPRNRPVTEADLKRAKITATNTAMQRMLEMFIYSLKDLGAPDETIQLVLTKLKYTVAGINSGEINWGDVRRVLKAEYDIELKLN